MFRIAAVILFFTTVLTAEENALFMLENLRYQLTHYYHKLLGTLDNDPKCNSVCTIAQQKRIRKNKIRIITSVKSTKQKHMSLSMNVRGRIDLPNISKKLHLVFSQQGSDTLTNRQVDRENENVITDTRFRIGLKYNFYHKNTLDISTKLSFKIHRPFGPFQVLSIKKLFTFPHDDFSIYTRGSLYYFYAYTFLAQSLECNFIQPLTSKYLLAFANEWENNAENHHNRRLTHHLRLHHNFNQKNHLVYWFSYGTLAKKENHYRIEWRAVSLSYIHYLNKWFYIQTIPRVVQRREHNFRNDVELTVSFAMLLGI